MRVERAFNKEDCARVGGQGILLGEVKLGDRIVIGRVLLFVSDELIWVEC
jgi:hypothetical protein